MQTKTKSMKKQKQELTEEQKAYNKSVGIFKRRINTMLHDKNRGTRVVEAQLLYLKDHKSEPIYNDIKVDDAITIMQNKIKEYLEQLSFNAVK